MINSMKVGREPMSKGITFVQHEIKSNWKRASRATESIPLINAQKPMIYQYEVNLIVMEPM